MKKTFLTILISLSALVVSVTPVLAATTASLAPTSVNVKEGQSFNLTVSVDPQGVKNYTIKMNVSFPADLLEAKSFNFGSGWMALSQPGYDVMDNVAGSLIKTAGYPGGFSSDAVFGVISFTAKKTGTGVIKTTTASQAFDANNQNVLAGVAQTSVSISAPAVTTPTPIRTAAPSPSGQPQTTSPAPTESVIPPEPTATPLAAAEPVTTQPGFSLLAGIGNFFSLGTSSALVVIVFILLILALVYIAWDHFVRHKKQQ